MTKLTTAVKKEVFEPVRTENTVTGTFAMTNVIHDYLQAEVDRLSQDATYQVGNIARWANIANYQKVPSFEQMFGDDRGNAYDTAQKSVQACAKLVAEDPETLTQIRPAGNVYGAIDENGVQSTVFSSTDPSKIQLAEFAHKIVLESSERYSASMATVKMLTETFGLAPTTSRDERYQLHLAGLAETKRRNQATQQRTEAKFAENKQQTQRVEAIALVANQTAHLC